MTPEVEMDYKQITTLQGMTRLEKRAFRRANKKRFRKVYLYDDNPWCPWCAQRMDDLDEATIDHFKPKSKGGRNHVSNLSLMHKKCNSRKSDRLVVRLPRRFLRKIFLELA